MATETVPSREIEAFLYQEAALLDARRYADWLALLTDDATYWLPAGDDDADPTRTASIIYDTRRALNERIARIQHPAAHCQTPPPRTSRLIANVRLAGANGGTPDLQVDSTFALYVSRLGQQHTFAGRYTHHLRHVDGAWRIAAKAVYLVNNDAVLHYNLTFIF
jgi:3-phenylpropionate/cinnamic acid dioxygenase small subunit